MDNAITIVKYSKQECDYIIIGLYHHQVKSGRLSLTRWPTRLNTLKFSDNNITLAEGAFNGLEQSLKNLNLKVCNMILSGCLIFDWWCLGLPTCEGASSFEQPGRTRISRPRTELNQVSLPSLLPFLNKLLIETRRNLGSGELSNLGSITALNLERNVIQELEPGVFYGINDTLSSLSLLNNLLTSYPTEAITSLQELRVSEVLVLYQWCWCCRNESTWRWWCCRASKSKSLCWCLLRGGGKVRATVSGPAPLSFAHITIHLLPSSLPCNHPPILHSFPQTSYQFIFMLLLYTMWI